MTLLIRIYQEGDLFATNQCVVDGRIEIRGETIKVIMRDNGLKILERYTDLREGCEYSAEVEIRE